MIGISWYSFQDRKENEERRSTAEKLARDAELFKLRQQLQPHFLFNSLNSISALIGTRPEEARHMIQQLSDFLRGTIKKEETQLVTLNEELQHLQLYLDIEKVRFGHRLITNIINETETNECKIPSLLLQPIVENAIKFGLYDTIEIVSINIEIKKLNGQLIISVQNPFDPETSSTQKGAGFGLNSVQRRLYLLFARNDLVTTTVQENIFTTIIKIPQLI
jgi:LytS/YehU family sensor histidine kinase